MTRPRAFIPVGWLGIFLLQSLAAAPFVVVETPARLEIHDGDTTVFGWQRGPIEEPVGGEKFAASAFVHPLTTPSGFGLTNIQPSDHLHHFGVWWPWKHLRVDGKKFNCWELQNLQGRQTAVDAEVLHKSDDEVTILATSRHEIRRDDEYLPVLDEKTTLTFRRVGETTYQLDIDIQQKPASGQAVVVSAYRYSGFSWRGPASWTGETSTMRTSGGHDRTNANHQPARWVTVDGPTPAGHGTMLLMSAAPADGGTPELLRVWGPKQHHGEPFVNFNPVVKQSPQLTEPIVARRLYRLILADEAISPAQADKHWAAWEASLEKTR
jgi:hypothetical protein